MLFISFVYVLLVVYMISEAETDVGTIKNDVYIIAHRGASGYRPENTIAAFDKAIELNADYIELDVQMSKDGELVVIHDRTVNRTTNGFGSIKDLHLSDLKKLDAGSWYHPKFQHEKIPTLKEVLSRYSQNIRMLIELKDPILYQGIEKKLAEELTKAKLHKRKDESVIVQSFDYSSIKRFHQLLPHVPTGILTQTQLNATTIKKISTYCQFINTHYLAVHSNYLKIVKEKGLKSFAWTVNSKEAYNRAAMCGFHGIITDFPDIFEPKKSFASITSQSSDRFVTFIQRAYQLFLELMEQIGKLNLQ